MFGFSSREATPDRQSESVAKRLGRGWNALFTTNKVI